MKTFVYEDYQTKLNFKVQIIGDGDRALIVFPGGPGINSDYLTKTGGLPSLTEWEIHFLSLPGHDDVPSDVQPILLSEVIRAQQNYILHQIPNMAFVGLAHSLGCLTLAGICQDPRFNLLANIYVSPLISGELSVPILEKFRVIKNQLREQDAVTYLKSILPIYFKNANAIVEDLVDLTGSKVSFNVDINPDRLKENFYAVNRSSRPISLVMGKDDLISSSTLSDGKFMAGLADTLIIDDCGHFPMIEQSEIFSQYIVKVLERS